MIEGGEDTKNRVKFLCSHGGKILPRPPDGQLKYVRGETRVVAVPRDIDFSGLMKKLSSLTNGDLVFKYQVIPEELDTLVSVTCDEDLQNMLAEHDRQDLKSLESCGSPKLRGFLFPSNPTVVEDPLSPNHMDIHALEQRYIDAINGVLHRPIKRIRRNSSPTYRAAFRTSSPGSSPKSVHQDAYTFDAIITQDAYPTNGNRSHYTNDIPKVSSSPSLYNLGHPNPCNLPPHQQAYYPPSGLNSQYNSGNGNGYRRHSSFNSGNSNGHMSPGNGRMSPGNGRMSPGNGGMSPGLPVAPSDYGMYQVAHTFSRYASPTSSRGSSEYISRGSGDYISNAQINGCRVYWSGVGV